MWEAALKILKVSWKPLLVVVVLTGCGIWFGTFITGNKLDAQALAFSQEKQRLTDGFSEKERQWDQERLSAANQYATDLKAALDKQNAWQQKADALTRELAEKQKAHDETVRDLKKRLKMHLIKMVLVIPALVLAACNSSVKPSATPEPKASPLVSICQPPPAALLVIPARPQAPVADSPPRE